MKVTMVTVITINKHLRSAFEATSIVQGEGHYGHSRKHYFWSSGELHDTAFWTNKVTITVYSAVIRTY